MNIDLYNDLKKKLFNRAFRYNKKKIDKYLNQHIAFSADKRKFLKSIKIQDNFDITRKLIKRRCVHGNMVSAAVYDQAMKIKNMINIVNINNVEFIDDKSNTLSYIPNRKSHIYSNSTFPFDTLPYQIYGVDENNFIFVHGNSLMSITYIFKILVIDNTICYFDNKKEYTQTVNMSQETKNKYISLLSSITDKKERKKLMGNIASDLKDDIVTRCYSHDAYKESITGDKKTLPFGRSIGIDYEWKYKTTDRKNGLIGVTSHNKKTNETFFNDHNISDFIKEHDVSFGENHTLLMDEETTMLFKMLYQ